MKLYALNEKMIKHVCDPMTQMRTIGQLLYRNIYDLYPLALCCKKTDT